MTALVEIPETLPFVRRPAGLPETCSDRELCEAVKSYLCGVGEEQIAGLLKVPKTSVRYWIDSREWGELCQVLKPEVEGVLGGQMMRLASIAFVRLEERLVNGDPVLDDEGNVIVHKPIPAKQLSLIATQMLETKARLEGKAAPDVMGSAEAMELVDLARSLKQYAQAKDVTAESVRQ